MTWKGSQLSEAWAILPLAKAIHDRITEFKEQCDWIMLNRVSDDELRPYCKAVNYIRMRDVLNRKYGQYVA